MVARAEKRTYCSDSFLKVRLFFRYSMIDNKPLFPILLEVRIISDMTDVDSVARYLNSLAHPSSPSSLCCRRRQEMNRLDFRSLITCSAPEQKDKFYILSINFAWTYLEQSKGHDPNSQADFWSPRTFEWYPATHERCAS
jgi:hypothetical protein